jgi:hypothetical protein
MSAEMRESWLEFQSSLDPAQVSIWELLDTSPIFANSHWTSVYIMSESPGTYLSYNAYGHISQRVAMSMTHTLKVLTDAENVSHSAPESDMVPGCALWVLEGIEIEALQ